MRLAAIPPLITAIIYLITGVFVLQQLRPRNKNALAYSLWLFASIYWQAGWAIIFSLRDPRWVSFFVRLDYTGVVFIPIAFYQLIVVLIDAERDHRLLRAAYSVGLLFAIACWVDGLMVNGFYAYPWGFYERAGFIHPAYLLFLTALVARMLYLLFHARRTSKISSTGAVHLKLLRWAFICYLPASFDFAINYGLRCYPIGFIFTLMSLAIMSYAIIKRRFLDRRN